MRRARAGSPSCTGAQRLGTVCNRSSGFTPERTSPAAAAASSKVWSAGRSRRDDVESVGRSSG